MTKYKLMKWKMSNKKEIDVKDMGKDHAQHTINMIIKNSSPNTVLNAILYGIEQAKKKVNDKEFTINGEMAQQDAMDFDYWEFSGEDPEEHYMDDPY